MKERLRELVQELRRTPKPIAELIPVLTKAADRIEELERDLQIKTQLMGELQSELAIARAELKTAKGIGPLAAAHIAEECAQTCEEQAADAKSPARLRFLTPAGEQLHDGMWGGAMSCAAAIRRKFGLRQGPKA